MHQPIASATPSRAVPGAVSPAYVAAGIDVAEQYALLARRLERVVRREVKGGERLIEDACQTAWGRLVGHGDRVDRGRVFAWLVQTARREAFRLIELESRELSLEAEFELLGGLRLRTAPSAHTVVERRHRIGAVDTLPERQRRILWMKALGYSYTEIATETGDSTRTVERQLLRARRRARAAANEA